MTTAFAPFVDAFVEDPQTVPYERRPDCPSWCTFHYWDCSIRDTPVFMAHDTTLTEGEGDAEVELSLDWSPGYDEPHAEQQPQGPMSGQALLNNARLFKRAAEVLARG